MSFGEELYDGTASFGRIIGVIIAIICTLFGIGMIIGGIVMLAKRKNDEDPDKIKDKTANTLFGVGVIVFGILFILGGWLTYYLTKKSKIGAAAVGVGSVIDMITMR